MNIQINQQYQQQQIIIKYIEGIVREDISAGKKAEGAVSQAKSKETDISGTSDGSKQVGKVEEEKSADGANLRK